MADTSSAMDPASTCYGVLILVVPDNQIFSRSCARSPMPKRNSIRRLHNLVWNTGNVDSARESTSTQYVYLVKGMMMFAAFWTNLTAQSRPACGVYVWSGGAGKAYKRGINEFSTYVHDTHIECRNIYPC